MRRHNKSRLHADFSLNTGTQITNGIAGLRIRDQITQEQLLSAQTGEMARWGSPGGREGGQLGGKTPPSRALIRRGTVVGGQGEMQNRNHVDFSLQGIVAVKHNAEGNISMLQHAFLACDCSASSAG